MVSLSDGLCFQVPSGKELVLEKDDLVRLLEESQADALAKVRLKPDSNGQLWTRSGAVFDSLPLLWLLRSRRSS